ncbi:reverse transcriptase domain-containing protein [Tanacetum coccineum]
MRTRNSYFQNNSNGTILRRRNRNRAPNIVEPELRTIVAPMAERTMEELLRAPTEGYGEAIVLPKINADHFEIKTNLLQLVQANPFYGRENIKYPIELVNRRIIGSDTVLRDCTLGLLGHPLNINLMPVELGSFNIIIDMDWLVNHHAVIVCNEKIIRIPYGDEVLIVQGDRSGKRIESKDWHYIEH